MNILIKLMSIVALVIAPHIRVDDGVHKQEYKQEHKKNVRVDKLSNNNKFVFVMNSKKEGGEITCVD